MKPNIITAIIDAISGKPAPSAQKKPFANTPPPEPGWVTIGAQNSVSEPGHHVYLVHLSLDTPETPFCFEESVGGGHPAGGGARLLSLAELDGWIGGWKDHAAKAGCGWIVGVVETHRSDGMAEVVAQILAEHRARQGPASSTATQPAPKAED